MKTYCPLSLDKNFKQNFKPKNVSHYLSVMLRLSRKQKQRVSCTFALYAYLALSQVVACKDAHQLSKSENCTLMRIRSNCILNN